MSSNKEVTEGTYRDMCTMSFTVHWVRVGKRLGIVWVEVIADKVVANKDLLVRSETIRTQMRVVVVDTTVDAFIENNVSSNVFSFATWKLTFQSSHQYRCSLQHGLCPHPAINL